MTGLACGGRGGVFLSLASSLVMSLIFWRILAAAFLFFLFLLLFRVSVKHVRTLDGGSLTLSGGTQGGELPLGADPVRAALARCFLK